MSEFPTSSPNIDSKEGETQITAETISQIFNNPERALRLLKKNAEGKEPNYVYPRECEPISYNELWEHLQVSLSTKVNDVTREARFILPTKPGKRTSCPTQLENITAPKLLSIVLLENLLDGRLVESEELRKKLTLRPSVNSAPPQLITKTGRISPHNSLGQIEGDWGDENNQRHGG